MAHLLMYSTNYTVCRLSACLRPHALRVHLQHHMIGSACRLSLMCDVRLPQALAEALTTSAKGMAGRRLLECSDLSTCIDFPWPVGEYCIGFASMCTELVDALKATWDTVKDEAVDAANAAAATAAATATTLLNEAKAATRAVEKLANEAAAAATKKFNEFKAEADQFIDDVGNAFGELGDEIKCAHPSRLPPPSLRLFYPRLSPPRLLLASRLPRCSDVSLRNACVLTLRTTC